MLAHAHPVEGGDHDRDLLDVYYYNIYEGCKSSRNATMNHDHDNLQNIHLLGSAH